MIINIKNVFTHQLSFAPNYKFQITNEIDVFIKCKCFNSKTNKEIKQIMNGGSIGYCINGKFFSLVKLKNYDEPQRKPTHFSRWMNLVNNFV